jgi:hypothetical protein
LYSDETGQHSNGRYFLVCGVVLVTHQKWIQDQLHHAERVSDKGRQDWKGTKNVRQRSRYIEEVLEIQNLKGRVFYAAYADNQKNYWQYTVDALTKAIVKLGADGRCLMRHQGFNYNTRTKLADALACAGCDYEIQTGSEKRAEIRLADALCGYVGLVMFNSESQFAKYFPDLPDWFIDLHA